MSSNDEQPLENSRGTAHFLLKWPGDKKQSYLTILDPANPIPYTEQDSGKFKVILSFECRGLEINAWKPHADFAVTSTGGTKWDSVDLSELDWSEYDDENELAVNILSLEYKIDLKK